MKIKVNYFISVSKEIEITPADYCQLRANTSSRPDIFPEESFNRKLPDYEDMTPENRKELNDFWYKG